MAVLERSSGLEVNMLDKKTGEAPLHALVKKQKKDRVRLVLAMLVHSDANINLETSRGATPLHLAVEVRCAIYSNMKLKEPLSIGRDVYEGFREIV